MSNASELGYSYKRQEQSLLRKWRSSVKRGQEHEALTSSKPKLERKIRSIYPRGKIGDEICQTLAYHTV
ncbi:hypothetical protein [Neptuniibacter sp. QD37_11]|uniref:hypothetical protein n=1 Tax=Neptuniibacter sp. QD37_11 TaxID=3398209 RepID=UPI0039F476FB